MGCGVGCRRGSDLALLWYRPAASALIQPLAWELPYATGVTLKGQRKKKRLITSIPVRRQNHSMGPLRSFSQPTLYILVGFILSFQLPRPLLLLTLPFILCDRKNIGNLELQIMSNSGAFSMQQSFLYLRKNGFN